MNKQILSIFVFCAFSYSTQAQEVKGGISDSMMQQIKQSYANTPADKAIRNAIGSNDIRKLALNQDNLKGMDTHFSIKVPSKGITDQKSSGRCWLFTGLNVLARLLQNIHMVPKRLPSITSARSNSRKLILSSSISWRKLISFYKVLSTPAVSRWTIKWWNGSSAIL